MKWQTSWQEKAACSIKVRTDNKNKYLIGITNTELE